MRVSTIISLGLTLFTTGITAFALPDSSSDCTSCGDLITASGSCGYNILVSDADTEATESQVTCMCKIDGFRSGYSECMSCLVSVGQYTSEEGAQYTALMNTGCDQLNSGAGCLAVGKGKMVAGALAVGLGVYML